MQEQIYLKLFLIVSRLEVNEALRIVRDSKPDSRLDRCLWLKVLTICTLKHIFCWDFNILIFQAAEFLFICSHNHMWKNPRKFWWVAWYFWLMNYFSYFYTTSGMRNVYFPPKGKTCVFSSLNHQHISLFQIILASVETEVYETQYRNYRTDLTIPPAVFNPLVA